MMLINMSKFIMLLIYVTLSKCDANYNSERDKLLREEYLLALGGNITLTTKEFRVNNYLMQHKFQEIDYAFDNPQYFNFSKHYFHYKDQMRQSKVYKFIKSMPKGAALHIHDMGILGPDYLLNLTYMDHLYFCLGRNSIKFKYSNKLPEILCQCEPHCQWQLMSQARHDSRNPKEFDKRVRKFFTLVVDNPKEVYPNINEVWKAFMNYFFTVQDLLTYRPNWEQYFYDVLKAFRDENVLYVEIRSILPSLYELDGTVYDPLITAKAYKKTIKRFVGENPNFIGAKLIYAPVRLADEKTLENYLELARKIKEDMPEYFAGFDLVGQEDLGKPLLEFAPILSKVKDLDFFFHAGETDWYGCLTDQNLFDAILLGTKRIGHGYALSKHPVLSREVLERHIGLEVNIISNCVLELVDDVRNHPASAFFAQGLPVIISSDDPGIWEAEPLSDDFYVAFVGAASKLADIRLLKALAINSLKFSNLSEMDRKKANLIFEAQWSHFIDSFVSSEL